MCRPCPMALARSWANSNRAGATSRSVIDLPWRVDISCPPEDAFDRLVQSGALDIETVEDGLAAIIPDGVTPEVVAAALGVKELTVSAAIARDDGSVWMLSPRMIR